MLTIGFAVASNGHYKKYERQNYNPIIPKICLENFTETTGFCKQTLNTGRNW